MPASTAVRLPLDDLPRPSEQTDRREVIATRGIGRGHDGALMHATCTTLILRSVFGTTQLEPFDLAPDVEREDDYGAFLASLLPDGGARRRGRR